MWLPGKAGFSNGIMKILVGILRQPASDPQQLPGGERSCQGLCLGKGRDSLLRVSLQLVPAHPVDGGHSTIHYS